MVTVAPTPTPNPTLREGSVGEDVTRLQQRLKELGYYAGSIDGQYGTEVVNAVKAFQQRNGLKSDGVAGPATSSALYANSALPAGEGSGAGTTLKQGDSSDDVKVLQQALLVLGYYTGVPDGKYDAKTRDSVIEFQKRNGVQSDGVAGRDTLTILYGGTASPTVKALIEAQINSGKPVRQGDTGEVVRAIQDRLIDLKYLSGDSDALFGNGTADAIRLLQQNHGLTADGIAGIETMRLLLTNTAPPRASNTGNDTSSFAPNNQSAEKREMELTGTLQSSLSGGGIVANSGNTTYYADGSTGGKLFEISSGSGGRQINDDSVRFLHAQGNLLTYVNDNNEIVRYDTRRSQRDVLTRTGYLSKMAALNDFIYYLEGNTLKRFRTGETERTLATSVYDFVLDVQNNVLYVATTNAIMRLDGAGNILSTILPTSAQQVLLCDGVLYYRQDGSLYRIENGVGKRVLQATASWMGVYKNKLYYISGSALYNCDTNGQNVDQFDRGPVATVSFLSGSVYMGSTSGGGYNRMKGAP